MGLIAGLLLTTLVAVTPAAPSTIDFRIAVTPNHGLPAVPPLMTLTVENRAAHPAAVYCSSFKVEIIGADGTSICIGCNEGESAVSFCSSYLDINPRSKNGVVDVAAGASSTFFADFTNNTPFLSKRLLTPGTYTIRITGSAVDGSVFSDSFKYTVDEPQGEDAVIWHLLTKDSAEQGTYTPFFRDDVRVAMAAHPATTYSRAWAHYADLLDGSSEATDRAALQRYLAAGLPEAFDAVFRLSVASGYRLEAKEFALQGKMTEAENSLHLGKAALQALQASSSPFTSAAAGELLRQPLWTMEELRKFADQAHGIDQPPLKAVEPRVDCVVLNNDGTFVARFGYLNRNRAVLHIPVGAKNGIDNTAERHGQPIDFLPGDHSSVFEVTAPVGEKIVWFLDGTRATAAANQGTARCDAQGNH